jgi:hypothetical protein
MTGAMVGDERPAAFCRRAFFVTHHKEYDMKKRFAKYVAIVCIGLVLLMTPILTVQARGLASESVPVQIDYGAILTVVLSAVLPPLAVAAFRWLWAKATVIYNDAKEWQPSIIQMIERAALFAVKAAEQAHLGDQIADIYENKKAYACAMAEKWLASYGITDVDLDLLAAAIEKAVLEEFNRKPNSDEMY